MAAAAERFSIAKREPCQRLDGLRFGELVRLHLIRPEPATRSAILVTPIVTRMDSLAACDLLVNSDHSVLCEKVIGKLKSYLSVM